MRISDWSSDVCSSDLVKAHNDFRTPHRIDIHTPHSASRIRSELVSSACIDHRMLRAFLAESTPPTARRSLCSNHEIGRASCRERVCQYVSISVVAVTLKKNKRKKKHTETSEIK